MVSCRDYDYGCGDKNLSVVVMVVVVMDQNVLVFKQNENDFKF